MSKYKTAKIRTERIHDEVRELADGITDGSAPEVSALLARRRAEQSKPGLRTDGARLALVIEGGGSRGVYSSGMVVALEEMGLSECFDAVYGSSAGALNGAWLLCGGARQAMRSWLDPSVMKSVISPLRFLWGRPIIDTDHLVNHVYQYVVPMDFEAILAAPISFHPLATDADTGESTDLHPYLADGVAVRTALRASTCLPLVAGRPVSLGGRRFVDAGVAEAVPARTALSHGITHIVALRTRQLLDLPTPASGIERRLVSRYLARHAPGALLPWQQRLELHANEQRMLAEHPNTLQIAPAEESPIIGRIERDPVALGDALEMGRKAVYAALS
ncbi:MAG: patatin-like phospholipase family protein [Mycobacterium sp.]